MKNLRKDRVLYFDLELTCWHPDEGITLPPEIIQIGLVEVETKTLTITREGNYYVKPVWSGVGEYCTELTGITHELLNEKGHPLNEVLNTINKLWAPSTKMAFAWGGDALLGFNDVDLSVIHAMYTVSSKNVSLVDALAQFGEVFLGRQHNALDDARNLATLHRMML